MKYYYTVTTYLCHDLELGTTELEGPFTTADERSADIETKRQDDYWNLREDSITIRLLVSSGVITAGEYMAPRN